MKIRTALATATAIIAAAPAFAATSTAADLKNNAYVTLSGTVDSVEDKDEFTLNYGNGSVKVDTNDSWPAMFDSKNQGAVKKGDKVVVTGKVDENWFTKKEIDAETIYMSGKGQTITYHTMKDKKWFSRGGYEAHPGYFADGNRMSFTGTVAEIKNDNEFTLNYGSGAIQVDLSKVDDVPEAKNFLRVGEQVTVFGPIDNGVFEKQEVMAEGIAKSNTTYGWGTKYNSDMNVAPAR